MIQALSPFERAAAHTLGIEGGFSDHPDDRGGATNWGITEAVAREQGYAGAMGHLSKERALVIYHKLYWERIGLDWVAAAEPLVALECFDTAVNMGVGIAGRFLQRVLNVLNRQGRDWPDLLVDGVAGPKTRDAILALVTKRGATGLRRLLSYLNALQGARYVEIAEARVANEEFMFGWGARIDLPAELAA